MMTIKEIFSRNIDRDINPAVVVGNEKKSTVKAEIEEYVFIDDIIENLYDILNTILNKKGKKTGIWINGYYGSGKSHFIKYVHYCLSKETSERAFERFIEAAKKYDPTATGKRDDITPSNIALLSKKVASFEVDNIMFNVEDETDDGDGERFTRIFLSMFNRFRGYNSNEIPTAILLEKQLDQKGKFEEFIQRIESDLGHDWKENAADIVSFELEEVLKIAKDLVPTLDEKSLHNKLSNPETYRITITDKLIPELKEYLADKPDNYRLLFLVDEVSAYVGDKKDLLLNLQSIVEQVSDKLDNKVWIGCTAQQSLEDVVSNVDIRGANDEFGKILGRFDTRISLESNDATYITQKRVLEKSTKGEEELSKIYKAHKDAIENQFKIRHDLYKGFDTEDDFFLSYPFVPYQFKLISDVFQQFQNLQYVITEVKATERSILGITHHTTKDQSDLEVGKFIPFDAFYNKQFQQNLTIRGRRAIENAFNLSFVKNNDFAERVVKTLFMISNLPESSKKTFPSNLENLTVLLMQDLDQNKLALQNQIRDVINKLLEESIIREEKGAFFFFNEDEINVQTLIKNKTLSLYERADYFDNIFRQVFGVPQKYSYGSNDFAVKYQLDDKIVFRKGDFSLYFQVFDNQDLKNRALENPASDIVVCFSEWLLSDQVKKDFDTYCQTLKFFREDGQDATGDRQRTMENFRIRNEELKKRLISRVSELSKQSRFLSGNQILEASDINGSTPQERIKNLIEIHLDKVYKHHKLAANFAKNTAELRASAASKQALIPELNEAENMVNDYITNLGNELSVEDVISKFSKTPFGWRDEAIIDVLIHLVKKKKREFSYRNESPYAIVDFTNKALSKPERVVCMIKSGEEFDQSLLDDTIHAFRQIFNQDLKQTTDANALVEQIKEECRRLREDYSTYNEQYRSYPFGSAFQKVIDKLTEWIERRDIKGLFNVIISEQEEAKSLNDEAKAIKDFTNKAIKEYDIIKSFYGLNQSNFGSLSAEGKELADKIGDFLKAPSPQSDFRHIRKAHEELKKELKAAIQDLKDEVISLYKEAFKVLAEEAEKNEIKEAHAYADEDTVMKLIESLSSLTELRLKKNNLEAWQSEQLSAIIEAARKKQEEQGGKQANEPEVYYLKGAKTISNEEELNAFIDKTRQDLLEILKKDKTIILQ